MAVPEPVERVVRSARRRLTRAGLVRRMVGWVGAAAALAAGLAGLARHWVIEWADVAAGSIVVAGVLGAVVWSLLRRPGPRAAALAVDRRLGGYDRVTTALELGSKDQLEETERRQLAAASAWAEARDTDRVATLMPDQRALGLAALSVAVLTALLLIPAPTDAALAEREAERAAIEEEADRLEDLAGELPEEVADRLEAVVEELREAADLETALTTLGDARQDLTESLDPAALARRTGLSGLETSFEQDPVAEGDSASEQLENLARSLESGDMSGLASAVSQLRQRAADAAGVDPELSEALERAASQLTQLGAGTAEPAEAAEALEEAAREIQEAQADSEVDQATAQAAGELAESQQQLAGQGPGQAQGQGQGQGEAQGQGQGQGRGQGQGAGGAGGGNGAGGQQGPGSGSGSGGSGMGPGGTGDDDPATDPRRGTVFDPIDEALGDREQVDIAPSDDQGEVRGLTDGRGGVENLPLTPYSDRIGEYRDTALGSLDSLTVPASVRNVVRDYFTQLSP